MPSKAVKPTSPTSHDMALAAFIDEQRENLVALFTLTWTRPPFPPLVGALMILHQIESLSLNANLPGPLIHPTRIVGSVHDGIRP